MPIPLAGAAIAATMGVVGGRLVKKQLETHKKLEKLNKNISRNEGGIKGRGGANVSQVYK
jgi:hypothetical protein